MTPEVAIVDRLVALSTSAGSRVYQLVLPESFTSPALRVQVIDDQATPHLRGGGSSLRRARIQVDAYAKAGSGTDPYTEASDLGEEVIGDDAGSGLSGFVGTVSGMEIQSVQFIDRQALYEADELRLVRNRMDFFVWYRPA